MKLSRAWIGGGFGLATLVGSVFVLAACSSDDNDNPAPPAGGSTGSAGTPSVAGTPSTAGAGPVAGSPSTSGGETGTAGSGTGGATGGTGGGDTGGAQGFECNAKTATCSIIGDFPATTMAAFGSGDFQGGFAVFGEGLTRDATKTDVLAIKGEVKGYGFGFNIWFAYCSSFAGSTGISFKLGGTVGSAAKTINFEPQTNSNYPWQAFPTDKKGACTSPTPDNPWNDCVPGSKGGIMVPETPAEITVQWSDITGGKPVPWSAESSPGELIGLQWQFPWGGASDTPYMVDITLDDVKILGAAATDACAPIGAGGSPGTGGAGGGGGASAGTGGVTTGGGGTGGGETAGTGGTTAGTGGGGTGGT